jgi:exonuclease III
MKIISWNCCLKLAAKYERVAALKPDILVVQECEKQPDDHFPEAHYHWIGHDNRKGLGILTFNETPEIDNSLNTKLDYFLPLNFQSGLKLLGVWSFNHRAEKRFGIGHKGHVSDALNYYGDWLRDSDEAIVTGDFNNSAVWDKGKKDSNFLEINKTLESWDFFSCYHSFTQEPFGEETAATLFHTKNKLKPYHIDYLYLKGMQNNSTEIGEYEDWISLSDHMPLTVNCEKP